MDKQVLSIYKITCVNDKTSAQFDDSFWLRISDALDRVEEIKREDASVTQISKTNWRWRYHIVKVSVNL